MRLVNHLRFIKKDLSQLAKITMSEILLFGTKHCHKINYYKDLLDNIGLTYRFLDVEQNEDYQEKLRNLYKNRKLNFPTITINKKKLRNPKKEELLKWIDKLI